MGIRVESANPERMVLSASFLKNINHKKTVFGGSLHAVATLACWSLLHVNLIKFYKGIQIVIANSEVKYLAPVTSDFKAECHFPHVDVWERFLAILQKKGKARLHLNATIFEKDQLCVDYSGVFVAFASLSEPRVITHPY